MTSWYPFVRPPLSPYFPAVSVGEESICNAVDHLANKRWRFDLWVRKICWRRKWQSTPVFLPGESHGQRSLVGYSPWGGKRVRHGLATKAPHHLSVLQCPGIRVNGRLSSSAQSRPLMIHSLRSAWKWKVEVKLLSCVWLVATPWTACSPPASSVHGIFPARVLEWGAIAFSDKIRNQHQLRFAWAHRGQGATSYRTKSHNSYAFSLLNVIYIHIYQFFFFPLSLY